MENVLCKHYYVNNWRKNRPARVFSRGAGESFRFPEAGRYVVRCVPVFSAGCVIALCGRLRSTGYEPVSVSFSG